MAELTAILTRADTAEEVNRFALGAGGGWRSLEIAPLPPGSYRLTVAGESAVEPVSDVFVVIGEAEPRPRSGARAPRRVRGGRCRRRPSQAAVVAGDTGAPPSMRGLSRDSSSAT